MYPLYLKVLSNEDASVDITSGYYSVSSHKNICLGLSIDSSDLKGTFYVYAAMGDLVSTVGQINLRDVIDDSLTITSGLPYSIDMGTSNVPTKIFNFQNTGFPYVYVKYIADGTTPGTGTITVRITGK